LRAAAGRNCCATPTGWPTTSATSGSRERPTQGNNRHDTASQKNLSLLD